MIFISEKNKNKVLLLIVFSGILRLIAINKEIFYDEALSMYSARRPYISQILHLSLKERDYTPPMFHVLLHYLSKISISEIWFRIFSLINGLLTVLIIYKLGKLLFDNEFVGLLSSALVAFSESFIYYSVMVRVYSLWVLTTLASIYFFIKYLQETSSNNILFYIISTVLSIYLHYFGTFVLLIEILFVILYRKILNINIRLCLKVLSIILVLLIPHIIFVYFKYFKLHKFYSWPDLFNKPKPTIIDIFYLFKDLSDHIIIFILFSTIIIYASISKLVDLILSRKIFKDVRHLSMYLKNKYKIVFVSLYFILPILFVFSFYIKKATLFFESRYILPFLIAYYLIVAKFTHLIKVRFRKYIVVILVLVTFVNALRYSFVLYFQASHNLKKISEQLKMRIEPSDVVAVVDIYKFLACFNYLNRDLKVITSKDALDDFYILRTFDFEEDELILDFSPLKNKNKLWLIMQSDSKDEIRFISWFIEDKRVELKDRIRVNDVEARLYYIYN